jgi:Ca2+-binding EF-hand superfamily protein
VRARLAEIFPKIDTNHDMHIDQAEMLAWHDANGRNTSARRAKREFTWADTNQDGQVTLAEYLADLMPASFKGNETAAEIEASPVWRDPAHEWIVANKATFLLADEDRSGGLNEREHFAFSHPEDSGNAALHAHLRRQDVTDRDRNHDGRLDFDEFHEQLWYTLHEWEHPDAQPESDDHIVSKARFHELDVNRDDHLDADELAPVFHLLHPGEHEYARMQALHQMTAADNSGDGKLTLSEMVANPYVFYGSSVVDEEAEEAPVHDEF